MVQARSKKLRAMAVRCMMKPLFKYLRSEVWKLKGDFAIGNRVVEKVFFISRVLSRSK